MRYVIKNRTCQDDCNIEGIATLTAEHKIQNEIRLALPEIGYAGFRTNIGQAWTGDEVIRLMNGDVMIRNARPFNTGLPQGFSDIFGLTGSGQFFALEVKSERGRVTEQQKHFLQYIRDHGGISGVARSVEDAKKILQGE